jgi:hypothetical protein
LVENSQRLNVAGWMPLLPSWSGAFIPAHSSWPPSLSLYRECFVFMREVDLSRWGPVPILKDVMFFFFSVFLFRFLFSVFLFAYVRVCVASKDRSFFVTTRCLFKRDLTQDWHIVRVNWQSHMVERFFVYTMYLRKLDLSLIKLTHCSSVNW